jgi:hypothetical protein
VTANQSELEPHKTSPAASKAERRPVSEVIKIAPSFETETVEPLRLPAVLRLHVSIPPLEIAYNELS